MIVANCSAFWKQKNIEAVVVMIYNYLYNQCPSHLQFCVRNLLMARCTRYNPMWKSLPVTCGSWVERFLLVLRFHSQIKLSATILLKINIVESGYKHHNPNPQKNIENDHFSRSRKVSSTFIPMIVPFLFFVFVLFFVICWVFLGFFLGGEIYAPVPPP